jgi:regulator of sigma E protease
MDILIKASQLILSLSFLIILHELGHFIPARIFKTRVEKFYLFFDWKFSLFKYKKGDTEYGIGWIPLGGYVKIAGMVDESLDTEALKKPAESWEFRSKPAWQRLIIMIGGVTVNIILGMLIYAGILFAYGEEVLKNDALSYGIHADSLAMEMGFRSGDKIISIDGREVDLFNSIPLDIILNEAKGARVNRNGEMQDIVFPAGSLNKLVNQPKGFISPRFPFVAQSFAPESPAEKAGLKKGDFIVGINGQTIKYFDETRAVVMANKGKKIELKVFRNKEYLTIPIQVSNQGTVGIFPAPPSFFIRSEHKSYGFFESIPAGIGKAKTTLGQYLDQFKLIFNTEVKGYESVGGFITFGKVFPAEWDWFKFWNLTAFFSLALAIMNILPIPALDGGHVLFLLYEVITRRKPSDKFLEYAQTVGMILLLGLFVYANGNDLLKLIRG